MIGKVYKVMLKRITLTTTGPFDKLEQAESYAQQQADEERHDYIKIGDEYVGPDYVISIEEGNEENN